MSEIIKLVVKLPEGVPYTPGADEFVITERHTWADVARWIIAQDAKEEVIFLLTEGEEKEELK